MTSYKQQALLPVLLVGVAYVSCRGRVPWRSVAVGGVLGLCVLLPATILYRDALRPDVPGASTIRTPGELVRSTAEYLNVRFRLIDSVALIESRTPAVYPYANGRRYTLLPALVALPRAVWPDKPILNDGVEFSLTYWELPPVIKTATPLTQPGDLYRNFSWPGVLLGMGAWGLLVGLLARVGGARRSPRVELVCLVALVQVVPYVDSDLPQLIAGTSRTLLLAAVVAWLTLPGPTGPPGFSRLVQAGARLSRGRWPRKVICPRGAGPASTMRRVERLIAGAAVAVLMLAGCGSSGSDQMVRSGTVAVQQKADGALASIPAPLTIKDVEKQPADSPQQALTRLFFWTQWGNLPAVADLYDRRIIAIVGRSNIVGAYDYLRPDLLTSRLRILAARRSGAGVFVSAEVASTAGSPRREGFLLVRRGGAWRVVYDTLLERAVEGYTIGQLAPGDPTPSLAAQRSATRVAKRYRDAYGSLGSRGTSSASGPVQPA